MNKKLMKLTAVIATAALVFSLAACGEKPADNGTTTNTPAASATQAPADTKAPDATKAPDPTKAPDATATPVPTEAPKEIVTLRWGTHWVQGLDPWFKDEVTGEYVMAEDQREARIAAEQACLEQLGVKFEYVQYADNTTVSLLQSVMAGNPVCDIAVLWGGSENTILAQNIVKNLDNFTYLFEENESMSWMLDAPLYGHHYLLSDVVRFMPRWPLCYNISMIEAVDSLKDANGNTIYPNTLFDEGKWTWSAFKDYLEKIDAFYKSNDKIDAYYTDTRFATLSAAYSAGAAIYGADGLGVESQGMKDAWAFVKSLLDAGLITVELYDDGYTPGWCWPAYHLQDGQTVFADAPDWLINGAASGCADRGESIGIVPWPRSDKLAADDDAYSQAMTVGDSICILKGIDDKTTELAIKALMLFTEVYNCELGGVDTFEEYLEAASAQQAAAYGFDIFHEKIGDSILNSFQYLTEKVQGGNDYSDLLGFRVIWDDVIGKSYFGIDGYASYDVSIAQDINKFSDKISEMEKILSGDKPNDNVKPTVSHVDPVAVPVGTKEGDAIWAQYVSATDNIDGELPMSSCVFEWNDGFSTDIFNTVGYYHRAFKARFNDNAGNSDYNTLSIYVYNPDNKTAPVVNVGDSIPEIELNADVNAIKWAGEGGLIASATDADGLDVSANVVPDLSTLDTSTAGTYTVKLTVTDYAGNSTEATVTVNVVAPAAN